MSKDRIKFTRELNNAVKRYASGCTDTKGRRTGDGMIETRKVYEYALTTAKQMAIMPSNTPAHLDFYVYANFMQLLNEKLPHTTAERPLVKSYVAEAYTTAIERGNSLLKSLNKPVSLW